MVMKKKSLLSLLTIANQLLLPNTIQVIRLAVTETITNYHFLSTVFMLIKSILERVCNTLSIYSNKNISFWI